MPWLLIMLACASLQAAESTESILCIGDEHIGAYFSALGKASASTMGRRSIKFAEKEKKGLTAAELHEDFARDVVKKKPTKVIISIGANDLWDFSKDKAVDGGRLEAVSALIGDMITQLKAAGIEAILVTPPAFTPDTPDLKATMASLSDALRTLGNTQGTRVIDLHSVTGAEGSYDKRGRLEKSAQEALVAALQRGAGIAPGSLPRFQEFERAVLFTDATKLASNLDNDRELKPAFKRRHGESIDLVFVEKDLPSITTDLDLIFNQRPRSMVLCYGHRLLLADAPADTFRDALDALLLNLKKSNIDPIYLATPIPANETGVMAVWNPTSPRALLALAYADATRTLAIKYGLPVIDLTANATTYITQVPTATFLAQTRAESPYASVASDGTLLTSLALRIAFDLGP